MGGRYPGYGRYMPVGIDGGDGKAVAVGFALVAFAAAGIAAAAALSGMFARKGRS